MSQQYLDPSHFMPMPELLTDEPGVYDIIDSREVRGLPTNGMVDQVNQIMLVPLEPSGRVVSRHENGHVMWSPTRPLATRGYRGYLQAVEDARINRGLQCIDVAIDLDEEQLARVVELGAGDLERGGGGHVHWALRTIASYGTNARKPLLALIVEDPTLPLGFDRRLPPPLSHRVRDIVLCTHRKVERARVRDGGPVGTPESARRIARWLRGELLKLGLPEPKNTTTTLCCLGAGPRPLGTAGRGRRGLHAHLLLGGKGGGPGPGRMRVSQPPLPHACATASRGVSRGRRCATEGTLMRDISRFAYDQKVFAAPTRRRRGGASVLIDTSGSMRLDSDDLDTIIAGAPNATLVAIYSGGKKEGELRVVVRDGRRIGVEGLEPYGLANVVDVPALEWLAKQPGPRIWISDGRVTGLGDEASSKVTNRCARICRRADIRRVGDACEAAKLLAGRRAR